MRKTIIFCTVILLICVAAIGIYKINKTHHNTAAEPPVASVSATDLYSQFSHTETQATKKWVGKVLEISGIISSISETGKYISINLRAGSDAGVNCNVLKNELESGEVLDTGQVITIKGKCAGFLIDVNMVDCVIKK